MVVGGAAPASDHEVRWLTLGRAEELLGVSPATLRQWADRGQIRSFRTPGGHRRFAEADILAMTEALPLKEHSAFDAFSDRAISRIRRRLAQPNAPQGAWLRTLAPEDRDRLRLFGRQLLRLAAAAARTQRRSRIAAEARLIGDAYAREGLRRGLRLVEVLEAFVFFREMLHDAVQQLVQQEGAAPAQALELWRHINSTLDDVLLAAAGAYDAPTAAPPPPER